VTKKITTPRTKSAKKYPYHPANRRQLNVAFKNKTFVEHCAAIWNWGKSDTNRTPHWYAVFNVRLLILLCIKPATKATKMQIAIDMKRKLCIWNQFDDGTYLTTILCGWKIVFGLRRYILEM